MDLKLLLFHSLVIVWCFRGKKKFDNECLMGDTTEVIKMLMGKEKLGSCESQ